MKLLQINTSVRAQDANSTKLAAMISKRIQDKHPAASLEVLDLGKTPHPVLDEAAVAALLTPGEKRDAAQAARVAQDDAMIAKVQSSDAIVIGVPMYNFGISVQLKSFFDAISRAGVTFRYTENGPEGLIKGKKVYVALARGGLYRDTPADSQVPYLKTILGFLGMTDVAYVYAEGLAMGPDGVTKAFAEAEKQLNQIFA